MVEGRKAVTGKQVLGALLRLEQCELRRVKGSHHIVRCGSCQASLPVHRNEDLRLGTLRSIAQALRPCIGEQEWMP